MQDVRSLAPQSDAVVIVDVLSFSTAVDIAVARGASMLPYRWKDASAEAYARSKGAVSAGPRNAATGYSLSPASLEAIEPGAALVLAFAEWKYSEPCRGGDDTHVLCMSA
jgi:2-phosphosulfolactate phosphatase